LTSSTHKLGAPTERRASVRGVPLDDARDRLVARDEDHVERDERVVHPERVIALAAHHEQHAGVERQMLAVHEAARDPRLRRHDLGDDRDLAARRLDVDLRLRDRRGRLRIRRRRGHRSIFALAGAAASEGDDEHGQPHASTLP
jgi:hypothetical protein